MKTTEKPSENISDQSTLSDPAFSVGEWVYEESATPSESFLIRVIQHDQYNSGETNNQSIVIGSLDNWDKNGLDPGKSNVDQRGNARLISGARECYEACKQALDLIESVRRSSGTGPFLVNFGEGVRGRLIAAVKKVEGNHNGEA